MDILITITIHCYNNFGKSIEIKVDIQRSNGRIHSAVISGVNAEMQSVTVEWFEGGETKGKEVRTFNAIFIWRYDGNKSKWSSIL